MYDFPLNQWERCSAWICAALEKSGSAYSVDDVLAEVEAGRAQFWPGERCALVTQILTYPQEKRIRVWLAGGDLDEIRSFMDMGRTWASQIGATAIELVGRRGWAKVLGDDGFKEQCVHLVKEL